MCVCIRVLDSFPGTQSVPSQGRQRHRKGGTAHNRSTPPKAVPAGVLCVRRGVKRGKKFSHVFLAMRKRSRSIQTAVLGKKRPWLVWSINGRPRTRTRNRCHCRVCVINYLVGSKSGPAKAGPAGPAAPPLLAPGNEAS